MSRLRAFVPLLILIAIGVAVGASGVLQHPAPNKIMAQQAGWLRDIAAHPALAYIVYIVLLTLSVAAAMPGPLLIIIAGGKHFITGV